MRRRRGRIPLAISLVAGGGVTACTLLTDLSGLSTPELPGGDGAPADGVGPTGDGSYGEGGPDSPDGAATYCEGQAPHDLCVDFDRGTGPLFDFDSRDLGGGSLAVNEVQSQSPPRSLAAVMPSVPSGNGPAFEKRFSKAGSVFRCAVDVRREEDGDGSFAPLYLTVEGTDGASTVIEMKQTRLDHYYYFKTSYPDGGAQSTNQNDRFPAPPKGAWARYVVEMDTAGGRLRNTVDGTTALDRAWPLPSSIKSATVTVGLVVVSRSGAQWSSRLDNVVCDVLP